MLCVNGCPKSGNHALLKAIDLLGVPSGYVNHIEFGQTLPRGTTKHIFIKRDPRNIIISWLRYCNKVVTVQEFILTAQRDTVCSVRKIANYAPWINTPHTYVVKFEDLVSNEDTMRLLAKYLQIQYIEGTFFNLAGNTPTWTGLKNISNYSDYKKIWNDELEIFWKNNGGSELLAAYGY